VWVTGVVTLSITDSSHDPNATPQSAKVRHLKSPNKKGEKELRIVFQSVLMRPLHTIKGRDLGGIHVGVRDLVLVTGQADLE
jgi:hypothetical protein